MNTTVATVSVPQKARVLLKEFQEKFAVFREYMPLAIGIDKQLLVQLPELDRKVLRTALGIHTNSTRYLKVMTKAMVRVDLEGNDADEVTDVHRTHASKALRERFEKEIEQRKAQRQAEAAQRMAEEAQRQAEEAAQQRAEKLQQLTQKFSRR